jgi:hypothetical protein
VTKVVTDYRFEEEQLFKFEIYDIDDASTSLANHDFLGFAECTLGQIVSAGHLSLTLPLAQDRSRGYSIAKNQHTKGRIILLAEELTELKEEATIVIEGHCLATSICPCLFTPKIFYTLSKINESGNYTVIYKSESYPGENPTWKPLSLTMNRICNGDRDRVLLIQCWKEGSNGYHTDLGKYMTTFNKLAAMVGVTDGAYLTKNGEPNKTARLTVRSCKTSPIHTFVEYISNGTQIHCCFAIDFTASNGDPNQPDSLHYFSQVPNMPNPYEQAIQSVGDIIKDYDQSQNYAVYGFGARVPPSGIVSHKFSVNFNATPFVGGGIPGVLGAYRNCIRQVQLAGPTNFAPIINDVAKMALQNSNGQHYYVLLMITDGIINDMPMTKEAIVNASGLPLSIVIVGVGGADFDNMEELDGDTVPFPLMGNSLNETLSNSSHIEMPTPGWPHLVPRTVAAAICTLQKYDWLRKSWPRFLDN